MTKIDPYNHEIRYTRWKQNGAPLPGLSESDAALVRRFLFDLELGLNVSRTSKRGRRSFHRLNTLRARLSSLFRNFQARFGCQDVKKVTEEQIHMLFGEMRSGKIRRLDGGTFQSVGDYAKDFGTFWRWHMAVQRKAGVELSDITAYIDTRDEKPPWVYLTEEQVRQLCNEARFDYRVLMMFLFDSGVRSPTELVNIRLSDFDPDFKRVQITDEASKTFGRRINLMLCSALVADYVQRKKLRPEDVVFPICPAVVNRYLRRLAARVLGTGMTLAGDHYDKLTMYDFRHVSACFWLPRYKSEAAMKYRFGWKQTERIHYYTELLGMRDSISEEDLNLNGKKPALGISAPVAGEQLMQAQLDAMKNEMELLRAQLLMAYQKMQRQVTTTSSPIRVSTAGNRRYAAHDE